MLAIALLSIMLVAPKQTSAATPSTLKEMQTQLEYLRANIMQLRTSSTTKPGNASATRASSTRPVNISCMQAAVTTREDAIMAAGTKYTMDMKTAFEERKAGLIAAWTGTDISTTRTKYNAVWKEWNKDRLAAKETLRKDRQDAWNSFKNTATKTCKAKLPKEETSQQEEGASGN